MKKYLSLFLILSCLSLVAQTKQKTRILIIFDASGSMTTPIEKTTRIQVAKKMAVKIIDSLSKFKNVEIALRVYGHQKTVDLKDCKDSKLEVPFTPNNAVIMKKRVNNLIPKGWTPIAYSLQECEKDFPVEAGVRNLVIIITDGLEECTGDPCLISQALQKKGIFLRPFIIGIGSTEQFKLKFNCAGTYYDANNDKDYNSVIGVVISQAMNLTSCQINLLDKQIRPIETNIALSIYDASTKKILHNYDHTMNGRGVPDTLFLDPMRRYDIVAHTLPPVTKSNVELIAGKHNTIAIDVPQGNMEISCKGITNYLDLKVIVKQHKKYTTINAQNNGTTKRYITGLYDLEILTTPRIYADSVVIDQNKTTTVNIDQPGKLQINKSRDLVVAIYRTFKGKVEWVCDINEQIFQTILMQPGKYFFIARSKSETRTIYTFEKEFIITSATTTEINL
ncbi:MAG: VWA domain-containing protein [Bacteroidetes bacterium]|nr:VWA domain-containing protein [Bacteroidota bacterium]